jgi:hypothetical protein
MFACSACAKNPSSTLKREQCSPIIADASSVSLHSTHAIDFIRTTEVHRGDDRRARPAMVRR